VKSITINKRSKKCFNKKDLSQVFSCAINCEIVLKKNKKVVGKDLKVSV
jgi:hypothetical protein